MAVINCPSVKGRAQKPPQAGCSTFHHAEIRPSPQGTLNLLAASRQRKGKSNCGKDLPLENFTKRVRPPQAGRHMLLPERVVLSLRKSKVLSLKFMPPRPTFAQFWWHKLQAEHL